MALAQVDQVLLAFRSLQQLPVLLPTLNCPRICKPTLSPRPLVVDEIASLAELTALACAVPLASSVTWPALVREVRKTQSLRPAVEENAKMVFAGRGKIPPARFELWQAHRRHARWKH